MLSLGIDLTKKLKPGEYLQWRLTIHPECHCHPERNEGPRKRHSTRCSQMTPSTLAGSFAALRRLRMTTRVFCHPLGGATLGSGLEFVRIL
ncbi:MAG: hypothetical protein H0X40_17540 [Chthoniobacterales bacterium]|nr:hypothetical protein [Chthoniobacterales bacterium]